jgi:DNA processing protein
MNLVTTKTPDIPQACPECLRSARLLADLAPYIERAVSGVPGTRSADLLALTDGDLAAAVAPSDSSRRLAKTRASERSLNASLRASGCWACCRHDPDYPQSLRVQPSAPRALFGRGDPDLLRLLASTEQAVSIVGARRASSYGREVARSLGRDLAAAGLTVISGMAFGIDACAHRGALEAGRTVAVLGCGADVAYPATHRSLWRRIQENGLVLSELPPGTGAWRWAFPARNRLIAALAAFTVVVEGAERSGSLLTAEFATDAGREIGAVPGNVTSRTSAGPNQLIAEGAQPIRGAQDVLDALALSSCSPPAKSQADRCALRFDAERIVAEDRVPEEVLRELIHTYGG